MCGGACFAAQPLAEATATYDLGCPFGVKTSLCPFGSVHNVVKVR